MNRPISGSEMPGRHEIGAATGGGVYTELRGKVMRRSRMKDKVIHEIRVDPKGINVRLGFVTRVCVRYEVPSRFAGALLP